MKFISDEYMVDVLSRRGMDALARFNSKHGMSMKINRKYTETELKFRNQGFHLK